MKNQQKKRSIPPKRKHLLKITAFPLTKKAKRIFIKPHKKRGFKIKKSFKKKNLKKKALKETP